MVLSAEHNTHFEAKNYFLVHLSQVYEHLEWELQVSELPGEVELLFHHNESRTGPVIWSFPII